MRKIWKRIVGVLLMVIAVIDSIGRVQTLASLVPYVKKIDFGKAAPWIDLFLIGMGFLFLWWAKGPETNNHRLLRLAIHTRNVALAAGGNQFSQSFLKKCLGKTNTKHFDAVMNKLEEQGYAKRTPFKVGGPWWEIH